MNVLKELLHSVYKLDSYPVFMQDRKGKTFLFGVVLVFLYFMATVFIPLMKYPVTPGRFTKLVEEAVPDFTLRDQKLTVDKEVEYREPDLYIYVNTAGTRVDASDLQQVLQAYTRVLVMDSEKIVIKNRDEVQMYTYSDLDPDLSFSKEQLLAMVKQYGPLILAGLIGLLVVIFVFMNLAFFFGVLFVALLGMIVASCVHQNMTFGQLYKLGVYTRTTPLLLKALISFLPVGVPFYFLISMGISLAYMAGAMKKMQELPPLQGPLEFFSEQQDHFS